MVQIKPHKALAQSCAEGLWRHYGLKKPSDLRLEDLAMARGVFVHDGKLASAEARLIRQGTRGIIRVRQGLHPPTRRKFAIAHELGHWELHSKISQLFVCTDEDMVADYKKSPIEAEANYFASALLMPRTLFQSTAQRGAPSFSEISRLAEVFGTSLTATAIRWMDLASDYCAIVACQGGRIRWWRGSDNFESALWITVGMELSAYAVANRVNAQLPHHPPELVSVDTWAEPQEDLASENLREEAIYQEALDQRLSLLWLA